MIVHVVFVEPSERYGFDSRKGVCVPFKYSSCGGNENNFSSYTKCQLYCEDPCRIPVRVGDRGQVFYGIKGREELNNCCS